ncbi:trypsin-like serine peptidase [Nonomuraea guangzhouensis]|uniref:Trypsin-like serine peptidase n=1 Tax=Nonomuraea guangzhouensis TaxID=1291555 RepID=A0ABW4G081_9ACTN|nr:trypsin-like serine protease [Nonomuraea guangzhouensis]
MIPRVRHLVAAALSALLLLPALVGTASASANSRVYSVTLAKTVADMKKVAAYWQPDRLKKADNYSPATPASQSSPTATAAAGASQIVTLKRPQGPLSVAPVLPRNSTAAKTMGKVFFRFGDKEYWCSASAVAAKNRSVVATAGHCAYDSRQARPADYWIFVPNPGPGGETPDGIYVGAAISMHEDWPGKGDYDFDYAFVTVHRGFKWVEKNGQLAMQDVGRLQDNVGGQGLTIGKGLAISISAFGYPAGPQPDGTRPFDGKTLKACSGTTRRTVAPSLDLQYGVQLQPCEFSAGASGGPWLINYQPVQKVGYLNGINSLTWNRDAKGGYDAVSSPTFNTTTGDVYRRAAALTTPQNVT